MEPELSAALQKAWRTQDIVAGLPPSGQNVAEIHQQRLPISGSILGKAWKQQESWEIGEEDEGLEHRGVM